MPPLLSAAMIVRNEADMLPECLHALTQWVDEICVVDTGSTDDTIDIARRHGAKLFQRAWNDDFSQARNASLKECAGRWIFVIDADERVTAEDGGRIRRLVEAAQTCCYRFETRNYSPNTQLSDFVPCSPEDPWARGFPGWYPSHKVRLFPNHPSHRFEGAVHELIQAGDTPVLDCAFPIHHYAAAKSVEAVQAKQALYLKLGRQKLEQNPESGKAWAELAVQYGEVGAYAQAVAAYQRALRLESDNPAWLAELGAMLLLLNRPKEALPFLNLAVTLDAAQASAWRNQGIAHLQMDADEEALQSFQHVLEILPDHAETHRYQALALQRLERINEALQAARKAVELDPKASEARALLEQLSSF